MKRIAVVALMLAVLSSCVSTKKFNAEIKKGEELVNKLNDCENDRNKLQLKNKSLQDEIENLNKQVAFLKDNNNIAIKQLQDLSIITAKQAESINKSLENIGAKDAYIQQLQTTLSRKDSLNMALVMNLKGAIGNLNDDDIQIKVDKSVVYIDISDKLLFNSGSYQITARAKEVLGKVAKVLKNQPDIEFMVEGHTDSIPFIKQTNLQDNWDLSVKRATTVVRMLQNDFGLDPAKMSAAGRGEYKPLSDNSTPANRQLNRRTRIIILPQLDQFFQLLERK